MLREVDISKGGNDVCVGRHRFQGNYWRLWVNGERGTVDVRWDGVQKRVFRWGSILWSVVGAASCGVHTGR
jgi:hypothetical protein